VSDALTQGTVNAGYSLVSRELMADCIETGHYAHHAQAMIVISGCDKSGAAALMPLARTNAFGLVVYPLGAAVRHRVEGGDRAGRAPATDGARGPRPARGSGTADPRRGARTG
jgi:dihydroxy-acid dehydratase